MLEIIQFIKDYIVGFFIIISILVFVHELGHYLFAKLFKVHVESFSIGFGPEIIGWTDKSGTRWKISPIPFGGYVKMKGEMITDNSNLDTEDSFQNKKLWQKALIVFAGPLFNLIFPIIILVFIAFFIGIPTLTPKIDTILPSSSVVKTLQKGDIILEINNTPVKSFSELQNIIMNNPNASLNAKISRDNKDLSVRIQVAEKNNKGFLGVSADQSAVIYEKYSSLDSLKYTYYTYTKVFSMIVGGLAKLVTGNVSSDDIGGPLKIAQMSGDTLKQGLGAWLFFIAMLSINLAVINLLPIPALDGGHLLIYLIQAIIRRPLSLKIQNLLMQIGFACLMLLMLVVVIKDIISFIK